MTGFTSSLQNVLGTDADAYPLLAERIAIDTTNTLRGAEADLRGFQRRPLLRRLWGGLRGHGQELQATIGQDLIAAQRATLSLVQEVMKEESRTQYCVNKVLANLRAVNRDVDGLSHQASSFERKLEGLRTETKRLTAEIETVRRHIDREANVRRLTERYRVGDLSIEPGEIIGAALYMASVAWNYLDEPGSQYKDEWTAADAVVRQRLDSRPRRIAEALLEATETVSADFIEPVLYLAESATGAFRVTGMLMERRAANLSVQEKNAEDAVSIVTALSDPDKQLESHLVRDIELVKFVARDLSPVARGQME